MSKSVLTAATSRRLWAACVVMGTLLLAACHTESAVRPDKEVSADSVRLFDDPPVKPGGPGCCH